VPRSREDPLALFSSRTRTWFEASFAKPTPAQALAWPAIARGGHVLLSAPTGSGKTLAAFLWALDRLAVSAQAGGGASSSGGGSREGRGTRVVYVSPLKALSYDIERNLRVPLRGIGVDVSVGIRTGDTPQRERAAMARRPPDILITTPESLYLILGSRAREMLATAECVIVDEIHAVAAVKRGAHLALTLERLEHQAAGPLQRIGLSATQRPLEEIGRFLAGPGRQVEILDTKLRKPLDLRIEVPVESMAEPQPAGDPLEPLPGGEPTHGSIWPAIYPELLSLVREHRSTIVFVNNRRSAERVALRLNELAAQEEEEMDEAARGGGRAGSPQSERSEPWPQRSEPGSQRSEPGPREIARAHHGSLAREERTVVEELLKAGKLPCLVATSSLELGIDMGAVDLVVQIESPKSVARGLQRIGRAGHSVDDVSKGRIFPKFRGDLLECAVVCKRMREGAIEQTVVPRNALDVLAQQIVAIAASAQDGAVFTGRGPSARPSTDGQRDGGGEQRDGGGEQRDRGGEQHDGSDEQHDGGVDVEELYDLVTDTYSYCELPRSLFENVLDMLDGRYPSTEFGELRPRIAWDRVAGRIRARRGARQLAVANAGTIPDRGLYAVTLPDGRRVGELDEEMVYEARPGQVFLLGASSWRIEEIGRDRVIVTPAPGVPGAVPFWKGEGVGRPKELGAAIGAFARWAVDRGAPELARDYDLDERAARNLIEYLREQQQATRVLPSDRTIVLERFRDEIGDWRLCVLSPYGGRVHAAWSLAISARIRELYGIDGEAIFSDDGIVVRLPDVDLDPGEPGRARDLGPDERHGGERDPHGGEQDLRGGRLDPHSGEQDLRGGGWDPHDGAPPDAELVALDAEDVEELIVGELGGSALFGARFRENAARALLIPRAYPGRRTPLWQQRLKAQSLLEVARRHPDFPIVLETYRECLRDVLDVPGLQELLRAIFSREVSLVEVETQSASPFASSLLFDYVASYMYEGDTPNAERRAAALSLDRELLRELLGMEDLRELIDPDALAQVQDDLQHRSPNARARDPDALHDVLRRIGDVRREELAERVAEGLDAGAMLECLLAARRALAIRIAGEERVIAADDAGLYRDALGVAPPGGLPSAFLADVPDALVKLVERYARANGPFTAAELLERYRVDASAALRQLEVAGELVRGELRPGGSGRDWCHAEVLRRLRRASLAALRKEIEPVDARALVGFLPAWQGIDRSSTRGVERLREVLLALQGLALPVRAWERDVLPRRIGAYSPTWLDSLCAGGEVVWVGAGALGRGSSNRSGRVALYFREDAPALGPPPGAGRVQPPEGAVHELLRRRLAAGPCFFSDLLAELDVPASALSEALWELVWAGEATNDAWAPLRARRLTPGSQVRAGRRRHGGPILRGGRSFAAAPVQGRWSPTEPLFGGQADPARRRRAQAELLLERYGLVTREHVLAEGIAGGFSMLYGAFSELEALGSCRRGYFVEGLGGAQFALPGAVERLRAANAGVPLESVPTKRVPAERVPAENGPTENGPAGSGPAGSVPAGSVPAGSVPAGSVQAGSGPAGSGASLGEVQALVLSAIDPAQPFGAILPWPRREQRHARGRPARVDGAYVVLVGSAPVLYLERGGRSLLTLTDAPLERALHALAEAVRAGSVAKIALERIDGEPVVASPLVELLVELGFHAGPRRLTLRA
jgi:ATP-dependent Lhr-like helicase